MKITRGVAGSSPNFPQIRDTIWPFRRVFSSHLLGASHKQFDELNTGNWYGYWTCYKEFYRTIPIKNENVEHHFCQNFLCFFPQESYLDVSGRIRAPGSKQLSSSFVSLMPTLPLSYFRAGLIGLATLRCWSEAVRNLRVFLCLWMSWSCFHLSLLTGQSSIWHWVFCLQAWLPWTNQRLLQAFLLLLLLLVLFLSSSAIGRLFVFALFLSCNRFLQSVLSGWRFLSRVVVNVPQCFRPLSPHWGFLVWSVASLSRGIWILLAGLGLPSSSYRSHFAPRCDAGSSRSGSLVCLLFGFVATFIDYCCLTLLIIACVRFFFSSLPE